MSKAIKENYLSKQNGCKIIQASSERQGSVANNILSNSDRELWIIQKKLPQFCIIDTSGLRNYPKVFNRIGFYCWHQYQSNPSLIEVSYNNGFNDQWIVAGKIRLELKSQHQYFKIKDIPVTEMKQLKLILLENFGDKSTYLNQVQLGYVKEANMMEASRQKTVSQFMKLTSTEKQLKKAQEQIKKLTIQNEQIKQTIKRQGEIIIQMQNAMKIFAKELEKTSKIQQIQTKNMTTNKKEKEADRMINNKFKRQSHFDSHSSQIDHSEDEKRYVVDRVNNKRENESMQTRVNKQSYAKSQRNSNKKYREQNYQDSKKMKNTTIRHSKQDDLQINRSESELSEYLVSQRQEQRSKYSQKCSEMMVKLQLLLAQRDKRNRQLRQKAR